MRNRPGPTEMSSNLPSSFASAAAGQNANRDSRGGRGDERGAAGGEWLRREGRPTNATLTLRRSSTAPMGAAANASPSHDAAAHSVIAEETPVIQHQTYEIGSSRYTRDELLGFSRSHVPTNDLSHLFMPGWNPTNLNGGASRGWGKSSENSVPQEPAACWDQQGGNPPLGLVPMSAEEREAFSTDINSPLKPLTQTKDGHQGNPNGRKASVSHGSANAFGINSPSSASRPSTRRRETVDSNSFGAGGLVSPPASARFSRDESSAWPPRKGNGPHAEPDSLDADQTPHEMLTRLNTTALSRTNTGGVGGTAAMWPPSGQTTPGAGVFGNFSLPSSSTLGDKRPAGGGTSRLAHLIPNKESHDSSASKSADVQNSSIHQSWRPTAHQDPFSGGKPSGSAVLGGSQDMSMTSNPHIGRVGVLGTPIRGSAGDFGLSGLNLGGSMGDNGPISPSETNPFQSPPGDRHSHEQHGDAGISDRLGFAAQGEQRPSVGSMTRGLGTTALDGSDRSQTSSVGAKGFPLSGLSGWSTTAGPSAGTPDRERPNYGNVFASSLFSPASDLQSPSLSGIGNAFGPAHAGGMGTGNVGRGSRLGSLFPPAMQAQMQSQEHDHNLSDSVPDPRQGHPLGAIGRDNLSGSARDAESPMRTSRGVFEELFPSSDSARPPGSFAATEHQQPAGNLAATQSFAPVSAGMAFAGTAQSGNEPPPARQMVMPDRMRWVYLDPQGIVQGPFCGLEMNDWYKANFFTPDLRVKKLEDPDFEPLGQLIRRIGNCREPFLVPQIGIPHGPPTQGGPFTAAPNSGGVLPPLSGVFPSFGRTLTAEEQNNLERRKQEEQYLMAQQREYMLRQQQALPKFPLQGGSGLQHHSSAHSLQSQPSFGSVTFPIGAPPQQSQQLPPLPIGSLPPIGFHEQSAGAPPAMRNGPGNADSFRPEDMAHLSPAERHVLANLQSSSANDELPALQQQGLLPGDGTMRSGVAGVALADNFPERLREFEQLRAMHEAEGNASIAGDSGEETKMQEASLPFDFPDRNESSATMPSQPGEAERLNLADDASLSLAQQVQQTQAAAAAASQPPEPDMPRPFPPPASTPLPAPTAQRVRSNLPEQYSRSHNGTPDLIPAPPLAPWAKDPGLEGQKGPSLKQIQEAEALKAAQVEEAAAIVRKAALEQEAATLREKERQASLAAALPTSSTWGHGSPVEPASPWTKPGHVKGLMSGAQAASASSSKKTLAEIQREEEVRKMKARDAAGHSGVPAGTSKSYANLASKQSQASASSSPAPSAVVGSGWATVGAGGKIKAVGTGPTGAAQGRGTSSSAKTPAAAPKVAPRASAAGSSVNGRVETTQAAMEVFNKWVSRELSRGSLNVTDIAEFQADLEALPLDTGVISDAIYVTSTTMNARHFAEEYVRRRRLADKGIIDKQPVTDNAKAKGSGGWSEVAKRSGGNSQSKEGEGSNVQGAGFKVVPSRKRGKK